MNWNQLTSISQLDTIDTESDTQQVLILKHSTRCGISSSALGRMERKWNDEHEKKIKPYFLDLLNHRDISDEIEKRYHVEHESPQAILIYKRKTILVQTHMDVDPAGLLID